MKYTRPQPQTGLALQLRPMTIEDLPGVEEIERSAFPNAWSREQFERFIPSPCAWSFVATWNRKVVGFLVMFGRFGEARIGNLAVHAAYRRQGIGRALVVEARRVAAEIGLAPVRLEVREGNLAAQLFYRRLGFRATDIAERFYADTGEDAFLMESTV